MKKFFLTVCKLISISLFFLFFSCKYYSYGLDEIFYRSNTVDKRAEELKCLDDNKDDKELFNSLAGIKYNVVIITDVHFGGENQGKNGKRRDDEFIEWLKNLEEEKRPSFVLCLGDVAEHGLDSEFEDYEDFTKEIFKQTEEAYGAGKGLRTFNVVGNHDLYNSGWSSYKDHCYPYTSFYKFHIGNYVWYGVDSASGSLGDGQLTTLYRDMKYNEKGKKKIVFTHIPAYAEGKFYFVMQNTTERNKFISYIAENDTEWLLVGHTHEEHKSNLGFTELNITGFLEKRGWSVLTIDNSEPQNTKITYYSVYLD